MTKVKVARAARVLALAAALVGFATAASAQRPSEEQIAAIRAACRSDFIAHCAGVTPGSAQALMCLREHVANLSAACQEAVNAASPAAPAAQAPAPPPAVAPAAVAPAPVAPPVAAGRAAAALARVRPTLAQLGIILEACGADMDSHCANATHGPGWELKCLSDNAAALSTGCEQVLVAIASTAPAEPAAAAAAPAPPPAPAAPAAAPPPAAPAVAAPAPAPAPRARPSREQVIAILRACRGDLREYCAGAEAGPGARIKCLRDNAANLSSGCQQALMAAVSGAPAEPAAAAPAAAPPPTAPAIARPVSPREVLFLIRTVCGGDFRNYCGGVGFGGGRAIGCLRENAANLSPRCRQAFMRLMGGR
jgi:hypothetical protein